VLWLHDLRDQTPKRNEVQTTDTNALLQFWLKEFDVTSVRPNERLRKWREYVWKSKNSFWQFCDNWEDKVDF
jgi:hypothetical protein